MGKMNNLKETISVILEVVDKSKGKLKKSAQDIKGIGKEQMIMPTQLMICIWLAILK